MSADAGVDFGRGGDPRMQGFKTRTCVEDRVAWIAERIHSLESDEKLISALGRVDYARVRICDGQIELTSISGASILSSVSRADGFVDIPAGLEGYAAGAPVEVWCYDDVGLDHIRAIGTREDRSSCLNDQWIGNAHRTAPG
jgi:hypothetical protein